MLFARHKCVVICLSAQREHLLKMVSPFVALQYFILHSAKPAVMMTLGSDFGGSTQNSLCADHLCSCQYYCQFITLFLASFRNIQTYH